MLKTIARICKMDFVKYLPVGNGDSILIKFGDSTLLTDLNYRKSDEHYDIFNDIKKACSSSKQLNYFISTHQDKDHVLGFAELFHCGSPSDWNSSSSDKLLVDEIICSPNALSNKFTQDSKDFITEVLRRDGLSGNEKNLDGNRLKVVQEGNKLDLGKLNGIVLAPNDDELSADSNNNHSLVIQWKYKDSDNSNETLILLGGDAEHEVWARLHNDYKDCDKLNWHLCTAPHHCSLTAFAHKDSDTGEYKDDDDASSAFSHQQGKGFVVASSKKIKRDEDNPPHYKAKNKWLKILSDDTTNSERFYCTATHNDGEPAPVVFELNSKGVTLYEDQSEEDSSNSTFSTVTQYG